MAGGVAHVLQIVVLAAGAHAALGRGGAPVGALLAAQEHVLELHHAGVGEQQGGVVGGTSGLEATSWCPGWRSSRENCWRSVGAVHGSSLGRSVGQGSANRRTSVKPRASRKRAGGRVVPGSVAASAASLRACAARPAAYQSECSASTTGSMTSPSTPLLAQVRRGCAAARSRRRSARPPALAHNVSRPGNRHPRGAAGRSRHAAGRCPAERACDASSWRECSRLASSFSACAHGRSHQPALSTPRHERLRPGCAASAASLAAPGSMRVADTRLDAPGPVSGFSLRKSRTLSLPWPMRSPS